jgi:fructuronate reductase
VLSRFSNPALRHTTTQVAMDGSQKLPLRLLGTVRDRLAAGVVPTWATLAVAGWITYVATDRDSTGRELVLNDPIAAELKAVAATATGPADLVDGLLGVTAIFGTDLPDHTAWRDALTADVAKLQAHP